MRVLFTTQSTLSHWQPLVPLAYALESGGYEVAFAATAGFCPRIEAKGFHCFRAGRDDTPEERQVRREQTAGLSPEEDTFFMLKNVFAGSTAERSLPDLLHIIREWRPDVVVRENAEFAGCVAAESAGIPHAVVQITAPWPFFLQAVVEPVKRLRASVGLAQEETAEVLYRYLLLLPRPPSLWEPSVPMPPTVHCYRYTGFNQSGDEGLPQWVSELDRRPMVYATLGTFENSMTEIFEAILDGLRDEPVNVIVTVGRNRDPIEFGEQPPNVHVERYIPQNLILPHCDLVICHGGSGTMMDALSFGLPMVLIPVAADQPENAQRCMELGVARVIGPEQRAEPNLAHTIRDATREVLEEQHYRQNAQKLRDEIEELPGLGYVVALLEKLAVGRAPLRRP